MKSSTILKSLALMGSTTLANAKEYFFQHTPSNEPIKIEISSVGRQYSGDIVTQLKDCDLLETSVSAQWQKALEFCRITIKSRRLPPLATVFGEKGGNIDDNLTYCMSDVLDKCPPVFSKNDQIRLVVLFAVLFALASAYIAYICCCKKRKVKSAQSNATNSNNFLPLSETQRNMGSVQDSTTPYQQPGHGA